MKRVLFITSLLLLELGSFAAEKAVGFGEFKAVPINGAEAKLDVSNGTFRLSNFATNQNGIAFASQPFSANGQIIARVRAVDEAKSKVGLVFRETTNSNSRYAGMFVSGSNVIFERLVNTNETITTTTQTNAHAKWLRVVREGDAFSGSYSSDGTNWTQISADTVEMSGNIFAGLAVVGNGVGVFDQTRLTSAHLASPAGNASYLAPTDVLLKANVTSLSSAPARVEFFAGAEKIGEAVNFPHSTVWSNALAGLHDVSARIIDPWDNSFFTEPTRISVKIPTAQADFIRADTATKGNWKEIYGLEGYLIMSHTTNLPPQIQVFPGRSRPHTWAEHTSEEKALARTDSADRVAPSWFNRTQLTFEINLADGWPHQLALYFLDWDQKDRSMDVEILDRSGKLLSRQLIKQFSSGKYLVWLVRGHLTIRITSLGGGNAVVNGLFFDAEMKQ